MVEQGPTEAQRVMPKIDGKDKISDPFAVQIRGIFKKLRLPFQQIRPDIGAENRIIRNAGIVIGDFRERYFDSDADLGKRRAKREWLEQKKQERTMTQKDTERYAEMQKREGLYSKLREGQLSMAETKNFIEEMQTLIPATLRIVPEATEILCSLPPLTVEELICLSVLNINQKPKVIENALDYLANSEGTGKVVLDLLKEYVLKLERGMFEAVYNDKHVTPLRNGDV